MYLTEITEFFKHDIEYLIKINIDIKHQRIEISEKNVNKETELSLDELLYISASMGNLKMVTFFSSQMEYNQDHYAAALYTSVIYGHLEVVKYLLDNSTRINFWDDFFIKN